MSDQPPNQSADGQQGDEPAQLAPDAPTEVFEERDQTTTRASAPGQQTTKRRTIPEEAGGGVEPAVIAGDMPRDMSGPVPVPPDDPSGEAEPARPALIVEQPRDVSGPVPVPPPESSPDLAVPTPPVPGPPPGAPAPPPPVSAPPPPPVAPPPSDSAPPPPPSIPPAPASPTFGTTTPGGQPYEPPSEGGGIGTALANVFPPERPERAIAAAFAGGLILALILKRLAR